MASIIIVENGAAEESFEKALSAARSISGAEILVIAQPTTLNSLDNITGFDSSSPLRSSLAAAIDASTHDAVLILDCRLAPERHEFQSAMGEMNNIRGADYICASLRRGTAHIEIPTLSADNLIELLASSPELPLMCVMMRKQSALKVAPFDGENLAEILARLIIKGSLRGQAVQGTRFAMHAPQSTSMAMSGESLARILRALTALVNIEDLFPQHPWSEQEEESAAAAYQTLAALFVRFSDLEAAGDCLRISDTLEDSPRSLALKGMIAQLRGETLGAVANMVASLQQYEMRKHENSNHYVQFLPSDVEKVSSNMQAGLSALNRADNETALECFSQAVFNFDPFYKETGLESKS